MTNKTSRFFAALLTTAALSAPATAQGPTEYGKRENGTISSAGQTHTYFFMGDAGDTFLLNFYSQWIGYPTNVNMHEIKVYQGATQVGTTIVGRGTMVAQLPTTGFFTMNVSARNNQWTGTYAFKCNRLNDPVAADLQPLDWTIEETISSSADFDMFTIHGEAGKTANLHFTSDYTGYPSNTYDHNCQLLDTTGATVASVLGNGNSGNFDFPYTGAYTLFVRARDHARTGWFSATLDCVSWPSCDPDARTGNFGTGTDGTNGVPTLISSAPPALGTTINLQLGNSYGQPTTGLLCFSFDRDWDYLSPYGARLLVDTPSVFPVAFPQAGATNLAIPMPQATGLGAIVLSGYAIAAQSIVMDPGATGGYAFSRGLTLKLGF